MKYDLAVIGGGPAGLMAALRAGELGKKVVLIEKNARPGIKLLLTGGGRCNITNNIPDYRLLAASFGQSGRFLLSAFSRFGASETMAFFKSRGLAIKTEKDNKVFPMSDRAADVLDILIEGIEKSGGIIMIGRAVQEIVCSEERVAGKNKLEKKIVKLILAGGAEISAANYLIATGGLSYPSTGSSGDGYSWLKEMGHLINQTRPALTPILTREKFVNDLEGLSLDSVVLNLYCKGKKIAQEIGPILFTSVGLSGPAALNISRYINLNSASDLRASDFRLEIDLQPDYSDAVLAKRLEDILMGNNKLLKNSLEGMLPARLAETMVSLSGLDVDRIANSLNRSEREKLAGLIKAWPLSVLSLEGYDRAMVTAGGVELKEVDSRDLRSKIVSNLFLAGEILDLAGPTGGYNLQLSWSTGYAVGTAIAEEAH